MDKEEKSAQKVNALKRISVSGEEVSLMPKFFFCPEDETVLRDVVLFLGEVVDGFSRPWIFGYEGT